MKTLFSADFYTKNRQNLRKKITKDIPIIIAANGQLQKAADTVFPFQQDANFLYVTGLREPDLLLVIEHDETYIIQPQLSAYQKVFDGATTGQELSAVSGVQNIYDNEAGWQKLKKRLQSVKEAAILLPPPEYIDIYGMYTNPARWALRRSILNCKDTIEFTDVREVITDLRMVKQAAEIEAIQQAIHITKGGLDKITDQLKAGAYKYEYEVEADLTRAFRKQNSQHAFDPIIASGERACTLHNTAANGSLSKGQLILFDVGAVYEGYAADITRTVAIAQPTERQQQVYEAVFNAQKYAFSLLRSGISLGVYEKQVEEYIGEKLIELGVISKNESSQVRKYYPHAASHHLGLDVHDAHNPQRTLEQDMIITVEPGIYIPEESIGVRIEDDVRITEGGIEILSAHLPSQLD